MKKFKDLKVGDPIYVENDLKNGFSVYDILKNCLSLTSKVILLRLSILFTLIMAKCMR